MSASLNPSSALILFAHGSRDARWAEPLNRIGQLINAKNEGSLQVHQAFLELMAPSLPDLLAQLVLSGVTVVHIVPIFLGQGAHVRNDLPIMIERLRGDHPDLVITVADPIGENELVLQTIATVCMNSIPAATP